MTVISPCDDHAAMEADDLFARTLLNETTGCWEWQGCRSVRGYGRVRFRGRTINAHRVVAHLCLGLDLDDFSTYALHACDNPPCVNPAHLYLGTAAQNVRDAEERGRARHLPGELHPAAKLSKDQVRQIRERLRAGVPRRALAEAFDVTPTLITSIGRGRVWRSILSEGEQPLPARRLRGQAHPQAKLSEAEVRDIKALLAAGFLQREIAARFNVGQQTVSRIATGRRWAHVEVTAPSR